MPTFTRAVTRRQLLHMGSRSASHILDATQNAARTEFVALPQSAKPSITFEDLGLCGHEYKCEESTWSRCEDPEEFGVYLERIARERAWFYDMTQRHGRPCRMRRRIGTPVEILTTTCSPWLNAWARHQLQSGRDPRPALAEIRNRWLAALTRRLDGVRYLVGIACHCDSAQLHFDAALVRADGIGGRIGPAGLRLVGPWACGTSRQRDVGATISDEKDRRLRLMISRFRARYGAESVPLDVALARDMDAAADTVLGGELASFKTAYASSVPALERAHAAALRTAADGLRQKADTIAPEPAALTTTITRTKNTPTR